MLGKSRTGVGTRVDVKGVKEQGLRMSKQALKKRKMNKGGRRMGLQVRLCLVGEKVKQANEKCFGKESGFKLQCRKGCEVGGDRTDFTFLKETGD